MAKGLGSDIKHTSNIKNDALAMLLCSLNFQLNGTSGSKLFLFALEGDTDCVASNNLSDAHRAAPPEASIVEATIQMPP